jgi:hypothetical protein
MYFDAIFLVFFNYKILVLSFIQQKTINHSSLFFKKKEEKGYMLLWSIVTRRRPAHMLT